MILGFLNTLFISHTCQRNVSKVLKDFSTKLSYLDSLFSTVLEILKCFIHFYSSNNFCLYCNTISAVIFMDWLSSAIPGVLNTEFISIHLKCNFPDHVWHLISGTVNLNSPLLTQLYFLDTLLPELPNAIFPLSNEITYIATSLEFTSMWTDHTY
jgi:hypothetical protein